MAAIFNKSANFATLSLTQWIEYNQIHRCIRQSVEQLTITYCYNLNKKTQICSCSYRFKEKKKKKEMFLLVYLTIIVRSKCELSDHLLRLFIIFQESLIARELFKVVISPSFLAGWTSLLLFIFFFFFLK